MISLTEKYCPKKIADIVNQKLALGKIIEFLNNFDKYKKNGIILHGPTGTGKTCTVYALANELNYDIVELNADNFRNKEAIENTIGNAAKTGSLFGKKKLILIDELESFSRRDTGGLPALSRIIKESKFPVVLIALDIWNKKFSSIKYYCEAAEFKRILSVSINKYLKMILDKEEINYEPGVTEFISKNSDGDLRAALTDLDILISTRDPITKEDLVLLEDRPKESKIFNTVQKIFKAQTISEAKGAFEKADIDFNTISIWLNDNITNEYRNPEEIAEAYDKASRADIFNGRILRKQNWSLYKYAIDLSVAGIASAKQEPYGGFTRYNPPSKIMKFYRTKSQRNILKSIAFKIAQQTHTSSNIAKQTYVPMLKIMSKADKKQFKALAEKLDLEKDEIKFLS